MTLPPLPELEDLFDPQSQEWITVDRWSADERAIVRAYALQAVAAERERIKAALLGMDDAVKGQHNYYAHAAWVLFERKTEPA